MKKKMICIVCPRGCEIEVDYKEKEIYNIEGYACKRGYEYAKEEIIAPKRVITSTVKVTNGKIPVVSVKTDGGVPKEKIFDCMKEIYSQSVKSGIKAGDVIIENILNLGVNVVATNNA